MPKFKIENVRSGVIFGDYDAASQHEALDIMARGAGYRDHAASCAAAPAAYDALIVTILEDNTKELEPAPQ